MTPSDIETIGFDILGELHGTIPPTPNGLLPSLYATSDDAYDGFSLHRWDIVDAHHVITGSAQVSLASTRTLHPCDPTPIAKGIAPYISVLPDQTEVTSDPK